MEKNQRIFATLDALRGIAAILVVMRHTEPFFGVEFFNSYLAVDFFFILSGFVLAHNYGKKLVSNLSAGEFMKIRYIRLYPLYFLSLILIFIGLGTGLRFTNEIPDSVLSSSLICGLLMLPYLAGSMYIFPINTIAWSLFFEIFGNFFYAISARFLTNRNLIISIAFSGAIYFTAAFFNQPHADLDIGWRGNSFLIGIFRFWLSFGLGLLIYRKIAEKGLKNIPNNQNYFRLLFALALVLMLPKLPQPFTILSNMVEIILIFPAIVYFGAQFEPQDNMKKSALFMGKISYPIYVLQIPVGVLFAYFTHQFGIYADKYQPIYGIVFLGFLIWFSSFVTDWFDKPVRKFITKFASKQNQELATKP